MIFLFLFFGKLSFWGSLWQFLKKWNFNLHIFVFIFHLFVTSSFGGLHWLCRSLKSYASCKINLPLKGWKLNVYTTLHLIITACNIWNSPVNSWLWLSKSTLWYLKLRANRLLQNCLKEVPLYIRFTYTGLCCILMDNSSLKQLK